MQHRHGVDRQQRAGTAEHNGEHVEGHRAEQHRPSPDERESLANGAELEAGQAACRRYVHWQEHQRGDRYQPRVHRVRQPDPVQRHEQAGQCRTRYGAHRVQRRVDRQGPNEQLARHNVGQDRLAGGILERRGHARDQHDRVDQAQRDMIGGDGGQHGQARHAGHHL